MSAGANDLPETAKAVLHFWFFELGPKDWFSASDELDRTIRERFGAVLDQASDGRLDDWSRSPTGLVALVIVLDQFSRNIHRGTARAYAQDEKAQGLTCEAIERRLNANLGVDARQFLYMPLMHAEDIELQRLSVQKFSALAQASADTVDFALRHRDIVEEYGRFPYRNAVLGRDSTEHERAFIEREGNPFG
ncbi:DUF924 family protein [Qipengyuania nanhaisediminis]|uniref:DUF924 family protein n=1 Tax=Qipengyuania nanhaisediminis TaxID=604088 RepID=UPI0038B240E0